ncbi:MAG: hypothetical protein EOO99_04540 [Pedobacter sp.]|jgi:hypothetical protein|nr:MAG: hypothetical protein EOO99_04540 [Pedobacter sp.]
MIRITSETSIEILSEIKPGDFVTDSFSKSGIVESIEKNDLDIYIEFRFTLVTGSIIAVRV